MFLTSKFQKQTTVCFSCRCFLFDFIDTIALKKDYIRITIIKYI